MDFSNFFGKVINIVADGIVIVAIHVPFVMHVLLTSPLIPADHSPIATATPMRLMKEIPSPVTNSASKPDSDSPPRFVPPAFSSSTSTIGAYTVVVNCKNLNPASVQILSSGTTTQTLGIYASVNGVRTCPSAEIQDINFDGYPDFLVPNSSGTGGAGYAYWLYSSSTREFYCPDKYSCNFLNPRFDSKTKTISSIHPLGASTRVEDLYGIEDGRISLIKHDVITVTQ